MNCILCSMPDQQYDLTIRKHIPVKHPKDVTGVICSNCMQILVASSQEKIKAAYQKAINASLFDKAKALETFLEQEVINDRKTRKDRPNMGGIRALRKIRPSHHKVRPKHPVRQLDKRRTAVC